MLKPEHHFQRFRLQSFKRKLFPLSWIISGIEGKVTAYQSPVVNCLQMTKQTPSPTNSNTCGDPGRVELFCVLKKNYLTQLSGSPPSSKCTCSDLSFSFCKTGISNPMNWQSVTITSFTESIGKSGLKTWFRMFGSRERLNCGLSSSCPNFEGLFSCKGGVQIDRISDFQKCVCLFLIP